MITGNEPAYPEIVTDQHPSGFEDTYSYGGLTILQQFAARNMAAILSMSDFNGNLAMAARDSVKAAKFLIDEINRHETDNQRDKAGDTAQSA